MPNADGGIVVAGHICLDIIPTITTPARDFTALLKPGALLEVGQATLCTGGPVSNTGLALHRLGVPTRLVGKVGDDLFGELLLRIVDRIGPGLPLQYG